MKKYLALGDSYTIGEKVNKIDNFPHQFVSILNKEKKIFDSPKIIAQTGWTTDELAHAIAIEKPSFEYDLVTLLIGVNNQYRARSVADYYTQFYGLLIQALMYANAKSDNVIVLSIPDWGLTPFNQSKDKKEVSMQINEYNKVNKELSKNLNVKYIDITESTRNHANDKKYLAEDLLHYSALEYKIWAEKIVAIL